MAGCNRNDTRSHAKGKLEAAYFCTRPVRTSLLYPRISTCVLILSYLYDPCLFVILSERGGRRVNGVAHRGTDIVSRAYKTDSRASD